MQEELPKAYEFKEVEEKWYNSWEKRGFFHADATSSKPAYCISIPPPNVTGVLHMGHALVNTLQDTLVRWKRMQGYEALWVPGTDHAGIATQTVVEREQIRKTGKRRKDFSREEFLKLVWEWKEISEARIIGQLRRLGSSCDWERAAFTMDEPRSKAVRKAFKILFDKGLIYRGDYLVNWDPVTQTALADDEVEYEEVDSFLWYITYPLEDKSGSIVIATTRPEVMPADVAIAVHPSDIRYASFIGKKVIHPLLNAPIPVIADSFVDPAFGTGAVKISPGHDHNDYQLALRHGLPLVNTLTPDAHLNEQGGPFEGLSVEEARVAVVQKLKKEGFLVKEEPHAMRVGVSYRSKAVIQPYLSKQWFVKMASFKETLLDVVKDGRVKILPKDWETTYFHWIEHLRDWCISRQLWWGHRIPIWYHREDPDKMLCWDGEGAAPDESQWVQDEDVLDTWFSSSLWPFSILGWPDHTKDLAKFYPNSTLITGHDILFFWVARMIFMGEYILETPPFPEVFLHGLIYGKSYWRIQPQGGIAYLSAEERLSYDLGQTPPTDVHSKWEKMSKTKGNIIDPLEIIDTYGTDAMRIALCSCATGARQIDLDRRRFEEFKNFINKIWNGARFVFMNLEDLTPEELAKGLDRSLFTLEDRWILSKLGTTIEQMNSHLEKYAFDKAAKEGYEFFWNQFCAYYVELAKPVLSRKTGGPQLRINKQRLLCVVLCSSLRLMHPLVPFITEELFSLLQKKYGQISHRPKEPYIHDTLEALASPACIVAPYPSLTSDISPEAEADFAFMDSLVHVVRNIRAEMQIAPAVATSLFIQGTNPAELAKVETHVDMLRALVKINHLEFNTAGPSKGFSARAVVGSLTLTIPLPEEMREKERIRLVKERDRLIQKQNGMLTQLSNEDFVNKAPPQLVAKNREILSQTEQELLEIAKKLESV